MIELLVTAAFTAALTVNPVLSPGASHLDDRLARAEAGGFATAVPAPPPAQSRPSADGDSLKNGAIIGALAGGATGAVLAAIGCGVGELMSDSDDSSCLGGTLLLIGMGAGIGAGTGVGIDAIFDRGPALPGIQTGGRRVGVRVRFSF